MNNLKGGTERGTKGFLFLRNLSRHVFFGKSFNHQSIIFNMNKLTIYIAGPITTDKEHYQDRFRKAEEYLRGLGWEVVNPALEEYDDHFYKETGEKDKWTPEAWLFYIKRDMDLVSKCDAIYLLEGWEQSPGANVEHITAKKFNLAMYFENGNYSVIPAKEYKK